MAKDRQQADPRASITPDSFIVSSELLGLPLARPWRRLGAMLVDLLAVALLANAGGVFLGFAAALALWRASSPERGGFVRGSLRFGAAILLFIVIVNVWGNLTDGADERDAADTAVADANAIDLDFGDLVALPDIIALTTSSDTAAVRAAARNVAGRIGSGSDVQARRAAASELLGQIRDDGARSILSDAIARAAPPADTAGLPTGDTAVLAYAAAIARGDSTARAAWRPPVVRTVAGDTIDRLAQRAARLGERNARLTDEVRTMEDRRSGFMGFLRSIADDLGIGFGWGALYFTAFLSMWRGQTPGKRMFGTRVIRLDGRPIGWWIAFERFGSYAASLSTGLLGFAQILWDRNRQGLHDKAVETVVIRDLPAALRSEGTWRPAGR